jgi:hypothetical protein
LRQIKIPCKNTGDQRKFNLKKICTATFAGAVTASIEADRYFKSLASAYNTSVGSIFSILQVDIGLLKKNCCGSRWRREWRPLL